MLTGVDTPTRERFTRFGQSLGLLFQIADDILDVTGTASSLGKSPGKDAAAGKLTYPAVYGLPAARRKLSRLAAELRAEAVALEGRGGTLAAFVEYIASRYR